MNLEYPLYKCSSSGELVQSKLSLEYILEQCSSSNASVENKLNPE